jgi:hypothetical protein
MPFFSGEAVALGQLVAGAFACGFNLYATVALLGLASKLGWFPGFPPDLRGLEHYLVISSAATLYVVEFIADKIPYLSAGWDAVHTLIRPLAAALLAALALGALPLEFQILGGLAAGLVALCAHGLKAGLRLQLRAYYHRGGLRTALSLLEDAVAIGLMLVVLMVPAVAPLFAYATLLLLIVAGPRLWRAGMLAVSALMARFRAFFGTAGWMEGSGLPKWLQPELGQELGLEHTRATRAALSGLRGVGDYRSGWLVIDPGGRPAFLYRSFKGKPRRVLLPFATEGMVHPGIFTDILELKADGQKYTLFLLKDGPTVEAARWELTAKTP